MRLFKKSEVIILKQNKHYAYKVGIDYLFVYCFISNHIINFI